MYYNDLDASATLVIPNVPANGGMGRNSDSAAAFVGELGLTASYDIRCNLSLRAGYQLLFLDGVALAADQVPNTGDLIGNNNTPVNVHTGNSLFFHGLHVGLEYRR